ncbi:hypothetical protein HKX48_000588 [Thoreauomyces humboldtii]|nr:hypothetical protein HKX48_000588 [Thoreauomyces humboldtii]
MDATVAQFGATRFSRAPSNDAEGSDPSEYFFRNLSLDFYEKDASEFQRSVYAGRGAYHTQIACTRGQILYAAREMKRARKQRYPADVFSLGILIADLVPATGEFLLAGVLDALLGAGEGHGTQNEVALEARDVQVVCRRPELVKRTWPGRYQAMKIASAFDKRELSLIVLITSSASVALVEEMLRSQPASVTDETLFFSTAPGITRNRVASLLKTTPERIIEPSWECISNMEVFPLGGQTTALGHETSCRSKPDLDAAFKMFK